MRNIFFSIAFSLLAIPMAAQTDSISKQVELGEVKVNEQYVRREVDHVNCVPTPKQRKHAHSGFELLRNMMVTGLNVDLDAGVVTTPAGQAALYINGRQANAMEIRGLRAKDIVRIEYYDMPTGKYAKDNAALNYVVKDYQGGGYTQVDVSQGSGYLKGDYNLVSKYSFGNYNANLWAGYNMENPKEDYQSQESYALQTPILKDMASLGDSHRKTATYVNASLSRMTQTTIWMVRVGLEANRQKTNRPQGLVSYQGYPEELSFTSRLLTKDRTLKPTLYLYYNRNFPRGHSLDIVADAYYARNAYRRDYEEDARLLSDVDEDYFYAKFNANYSLRLLKGNSLTFSLHEYLRVSQDDYRGSLPSWQHLRSSESIFFVDYSKMWGRKVMARLNPGVSYLVYKLHGDEAVKHLAPRLQASLSWMLAREHRLQWFFSLGNTYPSLSSVNTAEQRIDRVLLRRGNPDMDNSTLLGPGFSYAFNKGKWSAMLYYYYMYMSDAVVNTFTSEGDYVVNSFSSDARSQQHGLSLSVTWKPTDVFNVKWDGGYLYNKLTGAARERLCDWYAGLEASCYVGDFSFSASLETPRKFLEDNQYHVRRPWTYSLSAEWTRGDLAVILRADNLFMRDAAWERHLSAPVYTMSERAVSQRDNSFASIKLVYSIDYGKRVSRSPRFEPKGSESNILK